MSVMFDALNRFEARVDLKDCGVRAMDDGRVFAVTRSPLDVFKWVDDSTLSLNAWLTPTGGADPVAALAGTDDPAALAELIEGYHDYPGEDLFFALKENS